MMLRKVDGGGGEKSGREWGQRKCPATMADSWGVYQCGYSQLWLSTRLSTSRRVNEVAWSHSVDGGDLWLMRNCC